MSDNIKICRRAEFPQVDRELFIKVETDKTVIVRVTNGSTGEIIRLKRFEDYDEAMNYYSEQFNKLKSAEEYPVMRAMIEMFDCRQ